MRKRLFLAAFLAALPGFSAGVVTQTLTKLTTPSVLGDGTGREAWVLHVTCTADAADGSCPATVMLRSATDGTLADTNGLYLYSLITDPGTPAPTDNYDITAVSTQNLDLLGGAGADRDTANTEQIPPTALNSMFNGNVTFTVANNSVNSAVIVADFYLLRQGALRAAAATNAGDVVGPGSSTSGDLASFSGTTGKLIQDSGIASSTVVKGAANCGSANLVLYTMSAGTVTCVIGFKFDGTTFTTPNVNKVAVTAPATSATLTIADGKTLTASNTMTFTATDGSTVAFGAGGTVLYGGGTLGIPACVGTPGNTTGTYHTYCIGSNTLWICSNAGGCTVTADWVAVGAYMGNLVTSGAAVFVNSSGQLAQDQTAGGQFFWDATNHRLGIGTNTPASLLHVAGNSTFGGSATFGSGSDGQIGLYAGSNQMIKFEPGGSSGTGGQYMQMASGMSLQWGSSANAVGSVDTSIYRLAAKSLGVGSGGAGSIDGTLQAGVTAADPGCTTTGHIGKQWFDITTTTTAFKVCQNVAGTLTWLTK